MTVTVRYHIEAGRWVAHCPHPGCRQGYAYGGACTQAFNTEATARRWAGEHETWHGRQG